MKILFATNNYSKAHRFDKELLKHNIEVLSLKDLNIELNILENGKNAIENALIKARSGYNLTHMITIGMDDTLYLEGVPDEFQPGLFVRRINGKNLNDSEMINYYIDLVNKYGKNGKLNARWIYGFCLINNQKEYTYSWKKDVFYLVNKKTDKLDIGYPLNSISINKKLNKYFTDITELDWIEVNDSEKDVIEFIVNHVK